MIIIKNVNHIETLSKNEIRIHKDATGTTLYIQEESWRNMLLRILGINPENIMSYEKIK